MKTPYLFCLLIIANLLLSCNSNVTSLPIKSKTNLIEGDMSDYYKIVDQEYKVEKSTKFGEDWKVNIQFERNSKPFAFKKEDLDEYLSNENYVKLDLLDESGSPVLNLNDFYPESWTDFIDAKPGKFWVTFGKSFVDNSVKNSLPQNIKSFTISSSFKDTDKPEQITDDETPSTTSDDANTNDEDNLASDDEETSTEYDESDSISEKGDKAAKELCDCFEKWNGNQKGLANCQDEFDKEYTEWFKNASVEDAKAFKDVVGNKTKVCVDKALKSIHKSRN